MKTKVRFIVAGDIKSPQKCSLRVKWYQAVRIAQEVQSLRKRATMLRYTYIVYLAYKTFVDSFAKLRKATISFVMYVPLSVRMEHLDSQWMNFR
jgi:hypothetical protein